MKMFVFGVGKIGKSFYDEIFDKKGDVLIGFIDNNKELWGTYYNEIPIISPQNIKNYKYDGIVVASIYADEMIKQLKEISVSGVIYSIEEYTTYLFCRKRYEERYKYVENINKKKFDKDIVVYTAITGKYDILNEPTYVDSGIKYICFTNDKSLKSENWEVKYIEDNKLDNMHLAKRIKVFPNEYLDNCETSVWIDGKFRVIGDLREYISMYEKDKPMLFFPHFSRICLYEEAITCLYHGIGDKRAIINQITKYNSEGYPFDNGLYEGGCIVRNHNDAESLKIMKDWWKEINMFSYRDQISLPFVFKKNEFIPDICDQYLYKNKWLECMRGYSKQISK